MSKIFTCDKCGKEFPQPLDEEKYLDEHGVWHVFDLCAPCRKEHTQKKKKNEDDYFKVLKKNGDGKN